VAEEDINMQIRHSNIRSTRNVGNNRWFRSPWKAELVMRGQAPVMVPRIQPTLPQGFKYWPDEYKR